MINSYKSEKGITLISLIVTIIITVIILSIATYTGRSTVKRTRYYNKISQLKRMQTEVNAIYKEYKNKDEAEKSTFLESLRGNYKFFYKD